jgi:hypothetical protein
MATPEPVVRVAVGLLNEAAAGAPGGERSRDWPETG